MDTPADLSFRAPPCDKLPKYCALTYTMTEMFPSNKFDVLKRYFLVKLSEKKTEQVTSLLYAKVTPFCHVAAQCTQELVEAFYKYKNAALMSKNNNLLFAYSDVDMIEKSIPRHHRLLLHE